MRIATTPYGLATDVQEGDVVGPALARGCVPVSPPIPAVDRGEPFGGYKQSGRQGMGRLWLERYTIENVSSVG